MSYVNTFKHGLTFLAAVFVLTACGDLTDDLSPSGKDKRPAVTAGSTGYMPSQLAANFTISDSRGNNFVLHDHLAGGSDPADVVVLYFTMWCPVCMSHSDHMYNVVIPRFAGRGTVVYAMVDYVSGSVNGTRLAEVSNGYSGSDFVILSDVDQRLLDQFNGAMGIVVVIDSTGTILINEDYRDGSAVIETLDQELP